MNDDETRMNLLEEEKEAPQEVKKGVEGNLNFLRFLGEVVDLYIGKSGSVFLGLMEGFDQPENNNDTKT